MKVHKPGIPVRDEHIYTAQELRETAPEGIYRSLGVSRRPPFAFMIVLERQPGDIIQGATSTLQGRALLAYYPTVKILTAGTPMEGSAWQRVFNVEIEVNAYLDGERL